MSEGLAQPVAALFAVYDDPDVSDLCVFTIGDGNATSGLLITGRHGSAGRATSRRGDGPGAGRTL